ncbi:MAG: MFS transporter [Streptococcaceae bacterium]|jgi:MFS family permease|nr:MFS transporter [Streptococcaceae bacterium]
MTLAFIKKYSQLIFFIFTFYFAMKISSYSQVLYFQNNHQLGWFSAYYSIMAIAGAISFIISNQLISFPINTLHKAFTLLYSAGLFLRIFVQIPILIVSSAILSGISASIVLLLLRRWIYEITDRNHEERGKIHSIRFFFMQLAFIFSTLISGLIYKILSLFFSSNWSYKAILIGASLLMLCNMLIKFPDIQNFEKKEMHFFLFPKDNFKLALNMYILYILMGISVAIITSILPAVIHGSGWSVQITGLIISVISILTLMFSYIYQRNWVTIHANNVFLFSQLLSVVICCFSLLLGAPKYSVLAISAITEITLAGFFTLKELLEYEIIPVAQRQIFFGILQSSFLIGDSFASPIGTSVYLAGGLETLVWIYSLIVIVSSLAFYTLLRKRKHFKTA